jgi:MFS family permease
VSDIGSIRSVGDRRWLILRVIGLAQLMVVLDLTVMNVALPSAERALHFSTGDRQWVVTPYGLAFGSLLLLWGRLSDLLGRKITFLIGLVGFAGVSAIGGSIGELRHAHNGTGLPGCHLPRSACAARSRS